MGKLTGRTGMLIVGILVVAIVAILYLAFIGSAVQTPDVNDAGDDPTDGDRIPTAYGIMHVTIQVDNAIDRYTGSINSGYMSVFNFVSFEEGAVYENQKLDLLGILADDMSSWVFVQLTGPGQFYFEWESEHVEYSLSEWGNEYIDFTSGRCYFWDKGEYSMTVKAYADGPSGKYLIDTETYEFMVSV